jgi:hypothetical protein
MTSQRSTFREMTVETVKEEKPDQWDCFSFPCKDSCCQHGVDVFPSERDALIAAGVAKPSDFTKPKMDAEGTILYRTRKTARGCVFLMKDRGCRLHALGHKPSVCSQWPRNFEEAKRAAGDGYLPCFAARFSRGNPSEDQTA